MVLALFCLNLPKELRYRPENIFIISLTPPPSSPTHKTLLHLLDPLMKVLKEYGRFPGVRLSTTSHLNGVQVRTRIAPVLADTPARVELTGFMGHTANMFCAFCTETDLEAVEIDPDNIRDETEIRRQAQLWRATETKTG